MRPIDADELKDFKCSGCMGGDGSTACRKDCIDMQYIDAMPTIEADPVRHGRWLNRKRNGYAVLVCSECEREKEGYTRTAYCPNCGAKMNGGAENE